MLVDNAPIATAMNALTPWWYRARTVIVVALFVIAFFAPWNYWLHLDGHNHTWEVLAAPLGATMFAFNALLALAILFAALAAALRVWAAAYLGAGIVMSGNMRGGEVVAAGPYRHVRNPLYIGLMLHTLALALIMPPSGAVFAIVTIGLFELFLISAEEPFLAATLGEAYAKYRSRVPAWLYSIAPRVVGAGAKPRWPQAMLGEIYMLAVTIGFALFGWHYDNQLLLKVVIISLGLSIIVRALMPRKQ